jgi:hypothetical protein
MNNEPAPLPPVGAALAPPAAEQTQPEQTQPEQTQPTEPTQPQPADQNPERPEQPAVDEWAALQPAPAGPVAEILALKGSSPEKVGAAIGMLLDGLDSAIAAFARPLIARAPIPQDPHVLDQVLDNAAALMASLKSDQAAPAA